MPDLQPEELRCCHCASETAPTKEYPNDLHPKGEPQRLCFLCARTLWPGGEGADVVAALNRNTHLILDAILTNEDPRQESVE